MKKRSVLMVILALGLICLCGCGDRSPLDPDDPVTLHMWHNYGGDMQRTMDELIDKFNGTVGKQEGILINVVAISSGTELSKSLDMIVSGDPGAPDMPDIFTGYPKTAVKFAEKGMLADLDGYFTQAELDGYVDSFIEEGRLQDGGLYVFPIAKSTEVLYLNRTLFDAFAEATGPEESKLYTFEGLAELAQSYYKWTDEQTPDVADDGRQFYSADSWFNFAEVGTSQLGGSIFSGESLELDTDELAWVFETAYYPAVKGGFAIHNGYSSDLSKTGDIICSTGSSAGILFYGSTVTYPDGRVEEVEYDILPYPVFENGQKTALQRGGGLMVAKSTEKKEYAAAVFLKWLTDAEHNMKFVGQTGYLPVTKEAFEQLMPDYVQAMEDGSIKKMLTTVMDMYASYTFFTAPDYPDFDSDSSGFETEFKELLKNHRTEYLSTAALRLTEALAEIR